MQIIQRQECYREHRIDRRTRYETKTKITTITRVVFNVKKCAYRVAWESRPNYRARCNMKKRRDKMISPCHVTGRKNKIKPRENRNKYRPGILKFLQNTMI